MWPSASTSASTPAAASVASRIVRRPKKRRSRTSPRRTPAGPSKTHARARLQFLARDASAPPRRRASTRPKQQALDRAATRVRGGRAGARRTRWCCSRRADRRAGAGRGRSATMRVLDVVRRPAAAPCRRDVPRGAASCAIRSSGQIEIEIRNQHQENCTSMRRDPIARDVDRVWENARMAADDKDTEETTVYENEVQEGEPVIIRMPVDIRSVTLTVIAVARRHPGAAVREAGLHPGHPRDPDQLRARPSGHLDGQARHPARRSAPFSSSSPCAARSASASTRCRDEVVDIHRRRAAGGAEAARPDEAHADGRRRRSALEGSVSGERDRRSRGRRDQAGADRRGRTARPGRSTRRSRRPITSGPADAAS